MKGELKSAKMKSGVQSVIIGGEPQTLKWSANNLDMKHEVHIGYVYNMICLYNFMGCECHVFVL